MQKAHSLRAIGWAVTALGALLILLSAMIAAAMLLLSTNTGDGAPGNMTFVYGLLAFVFIAGIAAVAKGARMVKHRV